MLGVAHALTGPWWLHWVPMACLSGGLVLAGLMQVPRLMWSAQYAQLAPHLGAELAGGAGVCRAGRGGALVTGLVVATFVLLRDSAARCCGMCGSTVSCARAACAVRPRTVG